MTIELRKSDIQSGSLYISGTYICDTEEHPLTALAPGEYQIIRHPCKQYGRKMPVIGEPRCEQCEPLAFVSNNSTMPCICPMLKPGNGTHHRADGSIILGTRIIPGALKLPLQAFLPLAERIRKAIARGHEVRLHVIQTTEWRKDLDNINF